MALFVLGAVLIGAVTVIMSIIYDDVSDATFVLEILQASAPLLEILLILVPLSLTYCKLRSFKNEFRMNVNTKKLSLHLAICCLLLLAAILAFILSLNNDEIYGNNYQPLSWMENAIDICAIWWIAF